MSESPEQIRGAIEQRFSRIARSPGTEKEFPVGPASAKLLGYPAGEIDALPGSVTESFAGVGNPFSLGEIEPGQTVLDLGCGAGMDCILAARTVGPAGKVVGVDSTEAMIVKAKRNAAESNVTNVEFLHGDVESLPVGGDTVDTVISNGVFNLCLDKSKVLREIFRVLRPGGRLFMADMILEAHVTPEKVRLMGSWSG
jgi:arsenite methyltransferase